MSYQPPPSPPLPTFAIKDLCGPANPPGLISISKRRYDATIKSTPDATLLYLDDDDGELITVGSSFELSQRLEEPPPRFIREFRNPADGKLVHVFDINHTTGSLLEWRDHEAYSSKTIGHKSDVVCSLPDQPYLLPSSSSQPITYPSLPKTSDPGCAGLPTKEPEVDSPQPKIEESDAENPFKIDETFDILGGIEEHLSGLASVLQIAANTLQKAADKTRETDTSVVEDILLGVKGILTQVGSFGVEAFKELGSEINATVAEASIATISDTPEDSPKTPKDVELASKLAREAKKEFDTRQAYKTSQPSHVDVSQASPSDAQDVEPPAKVKFHLPEISARSSSTDLRSVSSAFSRQSETRSEPSRKLSVAEPAVTSKLHNPSFLDDSSEDADFTARYPPLTTVRRARSTIERHSRRPKDSEERPAVQHQEYLAKDNPSIQHPRDLSVENPFVSPFASPTRSTVESPITARRTDSEDKENTDPKRKPLPGAWPDIKNDSAPTLPVSTESSGDFFNRMVARGRPARYRAAPFNTGLHRSNTTASSNPASRLNGPFDPGFPYDTSPSSSHRPSSFRPHRHHRRSASPPRNWDNESEATQSRSGNHPGPTATFRCPPLVPAKGRFALDTTSPPNLGANPMSKFDSHRAIRHHRSVPQFHSPPPQPPRFRPDGMNSNAFVPPERSHMGFPPAMMPPLVPLTSRPTFMPRSTPPNLWAPWQSSPPMQSSSGSTVPKESTSTASSTSPSHSERILDSPISAQSTGIKNFEMSNSPPWSSAQPQRQSQPESPMSPPALFRYSTPPTLSAAAVPTYFPPSPPPPQIEPMQVEPVKDKIDECVQQLKMCGFGIGDENLKNRLHVYAVAADGDVTEAVEMIEQDRQMSGST